MEILSMGYDNNYKVTTEGLDTLLVELLINNIKKYRNIDLDPFKVNALTFEIIRVEFNIHSLLFIKTILAGNGYNICISISKHGYRLFEVEENGLYLHLRKDIERTEMKFSYKADILVLCESILISKRNIFIRLLDKIFSVQEEDVLDATKNIRFEAIKNMSYFYSCFVHEDLTRRDIDPTLSTILNGLDLIANVFLIDKNSYVSYSYIDNTWRYINIRKVTNIMREKGYSVCIYTINVKTDIKGKINILGTDYKDLIEKNILLPMEISGILDSDRNLINRKWNYLKDNVLTEFRPSLRTSIAC